MSESSVSSAQALDWDLDIAEYITACLEREGCDGSPSAAASLRRIVGRLRAPSSATPEEDES